MIIDGKKIAEGVIRETLARMSNRTYSLAIISVAPNFATEKYLRIKERVAQELNISLKLVTLPYETTTEVVQEAVRACSACDGVVLQVPYPAHISIDNVLAELPQHQDCDVMGDVAREAFMAGDETVMPPVVAAMAHIAHLHDVSLDMKRVVVVGKGKLVGAPAARWAARQGAQVTSLAKDDACEPALATADIVILGAGVPGLVTPSMVRDGAVLFDAGTSEEAGKLAGDADPRCAARASLMTPVPGGIGPVAVAFLFANLITLTERHQNLSVD